MAGARRSVNVVSGVIGHGGDRRGYIAADAGEAERSSYNFFMMTVCGVSEQRPVGFGVGRFAPVQEMELRWSLVRYWEAFVVVAEANAQTGLMMKLVLRVIRRETIIASGNWTSG